MKALEQFNIRLPGDLAQKVRLDATRFRKTLESVSETIFRDFFKSWSMKERGQYYAGLPPKKAGRTFRRQIAVKG